MNRYLMLVLGIILLVLPIYILSKFNLFINFLYFILYGVFTTMIIGGLILIYLKLSELREETNQDDYIEIGMDEEND